MDNDEKPFHLTIICGDDLGGENCRVSLGYDDDPADRLSDEQIRQSREAVVSMFKSQFGTEPKAVIVTFD